MEDIYTNNDSLNDNFNKAFFGNTFINAKQNESKGSNILISNNDKEEKKIENDKLCEQLKDSKIDLNYNISKGKTTFEKIEIGDNKFTDFNNIGGNDLRKCEMIENFILFCKDVEGKIQEFLKKYEVKYNFKIQMEMKENKNNDSYDIDCFYKLVVNDDSKSIYSSNFKDKTILINKTSEGFQYLLEDLKRYKINK